MSIREMFAGLERLPTLKREARKHYEAAIAIVDSYPCGRTMAREISPSLTRHEHRFDELMDEIAKLDPAAPAFRFRSDQK